MQFKNIKKKIVVKVGKLNLTNNSYKSFDNNVIDFLIELSNKILKSNYSKTFPDLASFGFFCRKSNLLKLKKNYINNNLIVGRGNVLHVCPSNVPMNFAFSLIFGLIAGNNNIVRLPRRNFKQVEILCYLIKKILSKKKFNNLKDRICLLKYEHSDEISNFLSQNVNARLIWGGDDTISKFKTYKTNPRCLDLCFSNRYSIAVINLEQLAKLKNFEMLNLINRFYNDSYIMDQQGCSSPQAVFWVGKKDEKVVVTFWKNLKKIIDRKYSSDFSVVNKKIYSISNFFMKNKNDYKINKKNFKIIRVTPKNISNEIEKIQCHYGTFVELNIKNLISLKKIINNKYQTLTYFGFKNNEVKKFIQKSNLIGIDRIVPIGRAFDMSPIWDGFDIVTSLSRVISE